MAWTVRIGTSVSTTVKVKDTRTVLINSGRYICIWQSDGVKIYCEKEGFDMVSLVKPGTNVLFDNVIVYVERPPVTPGHAGGIN